MTSKCPRCQKSVFHNEGLGVSGKRFHAGCFKCEFPGCTVKLSGGNFVGKDHHYFCKKHAPTLASLPVPSPTPPSTNATNSISSSADAIAENSSSPQPATADNAAPQPSSYDIIRAMNERAPTESTSTATATKPMTRIELLREEKRKEREKLEGETKVFFEELNEMENRPANFVYTEEGSAYSRCHPLNEIFDLDGALVQHVCGYWSDLEFFGRNLLVLPNGRIRHTRDRDRQLPPEFWTLDIPDFPKQLNLDELSDGSESGEVDGSSEEEAVVVEPVPRRRSKITKCGSVRGPFHERYGNEKNDLETLVLSTKSYRKPDADSNRPAPDISDTYHYLSSLRHFIPYQTIVEHYGSCEEFVLELNNNRAKITKSGLFICFAKYLLQCDLSRRIARPPANNNENNENNSTSSSTTATLSSNTKPFLPIDVLCNLIAESNSWKVLLALGAACRATHQFACQPNVRRNVWLRTSRAASRKYGDQFGKYFEKATRMQVVVAFINTCELEIVMRNMFMRLTFEIEPDFGAKSFPHNRHHWMDYGPHSEVFYSKILALYPSMTECNPYARDWKQGYTGDIDNVLNFDFNHYTFAAICELGDMNMALQFLEITFEMTQNDEIVDGIVNVGIKYATNPALKHFLLSYSEKKIAVECAKAFKFGKSERALNVNSFVKFSHFLSFRRIKECAKLLLLLRNAKLDGVGSLPDDIARNLALAFFLVYVPSPAASARALVIGFDPPGASALPALLADPAKLLLFRNIEGLAIDYEPRTDIAPIFAKFANSLPSLQCLAFKVNNIAPYLEHGSDFHRVTELFVDSLRTIPHGIEGFRSLKKVFINDATVDAASILRLPLLEDFSIRFEAGTQTSIFEKLFEALHLSRPKLKFLAIQSTATAYSSPITSSHLNKGMPLLEEYLTQCKTLESFLFNVKVGEGSSDSFYRAFKHIPRCYLYFDVSDHFLAHVLNKSEHIENYYILSTLKFEPARWMPWVDLEAIRDVIGERSSWSNMF